jgi:hypothetical protein
MSARNWVTVVALSLLALAMSQPTRAQEDTAKKPDEKPVELSVEKIELKHCSPGQLQAIVGMMARLKKPAEGQPALQVAAPPNSKVAVARGTAEDLKRLADVCKAVDLPGNELKVTKLHGFLFLPVASQQVQAVAKTLSDLGVEPPEGLGVNKAILFVVLDDKEGESIAKVLESVQSAEPPAGEKPAATTPAAP